MKKKGKKTMVFFYIITFRMKQLKGTRKINPKPKER